MDNLIKDEIKTFNKNIDEKNNQEDQYNKDIQEDNDEIDEKDKDIKDVKEVPEYLKDEHITEYVIGRNHTECISNLFKLHNESVNTWTMIVSNLSVLLITIYIFMRHQFSRLYSFVFILHLLAYTIHTPFSVGYHTFNTINKDEFVKWRKYDIYGVFLRCIILSFTMSFFTYSDFTYVLLNTSLTIAVVYYSLLKFKKSEDEHKPLDKIEQGKVVGYVALCSLIPLFYKVYKSIKNKKYDLSFKIVIIIILFYFIGIISYCFRIPDKYFEPGTFNKIGSSHNIMHFGLIITSICEVLYIYISAKEGNYIKSFK